MKESLLTVEWVPVLPTDTVRRTTDLDCPFVIRGNQIPGTFYYVVHHVRREDGRLLKTKPASLRSADVIKEAVDDSVII